MLTTKDTGIIIQIENRCNRILSKINGITKNIFYKDEDVREIICFNIFQIGELVANLSQSFLETYNEVPWKHIKGMRNRIVHGYDTIDLEIVWNSAKESIVQLKNYCKKIITREGVDIK